MPWRGFQLAAPLPFWRRRAASVVALPDDAESVVCFMSTVASSRRGVLSAGPVRTPFIGPRFRTVSTGRLCRRRSWPARGSGCASAPKSRCHRFQHVVAQNEVMHKGRRRV
jgi:hypothetical protein